jgi:hypothetical protein
MFKRKIRPKWNKYFDGLSTTRVFRGLPQNSLRTMPYQHAKYSFKASIRCEGFTLDRWQASSHRSLQQTLYCGSRLAGDGLQRSPDYPPAHKKTRDHARAFPFMPAAQISATFCHTFGRKNNVSPRANPVRLS